tara:strand:- start:233 stop:613 length:381 start_codon:yes stop_codon:yes gene_type:complete
MAKEENTTPMELPHACHAYRVTSSCVKEDVARNYINQFKLTVHYRKELNDGTPRRLWDIHDPSGDVAGRLYTARGFEGLKNTQEPWKDIFDFAEFMVDRDTWDEAEFVMPETSHFKPHNIEGNKKV